MYLWRLSGLVQEARHYMRAGGFERANTDDDFPRHRQGKVERAGFTRNQLSSNCEASFTARFGMAGWWRVDTASATHTAASAAGNTINEISAMQFEAGGARGDHQRRTVSLLA